MRDLYNKPGLVAGVLFIVLITVLTIKIVLRDDPYMPPEAEKVTAESPTDAPATSADTPNSTETAASEPSLALSFPLACVPGEDCWIARFMDREAGDVAADYSCGTNTQNGHKGTDITLSDLGRMEAGVAVLAAAPGTVLRLRDGMDDVSTKDFDANDIDGKECGNALILDHGNGWQTQYCHLKKGSLKVAKGDTVSAGDMIAEVGLSGQTEFPHLHFMARRGKTDVDPFDGGVFEGGCENDAAPLWKEPVKHDPFVLLPVQFSSEPRAQGDIWQAGATTLSATGDALILTARAFHVRRGDTWHFKIVDPNGDVFLNQDVVIEEKKQFFFQYVGKEIPEEGLMPGTWTGTVHVDHGPWEDIEQTTQVEITP